MKRRYDYYASKRNIPHLVLYSVLIGTMYVCTAINSAVFYLTVEKSWKILSLAVILLLITPIVVTDNRRDARNIVAVICSVFLLITTTSLLFISYNFSLTIALMTIGELALAAIEISIYFLFKNRKSFRNKK